MLILLSVAPVYSIGYSNRNPSNSLLSGITVGSLAISGAAQSLFMTAKHTQLIATYKHMHAHNTVFYSTKHTVRIYVVMERTEACIYALYMYARASH